MSPIDEQLEQALAPAYRLERELGRGGMAVVYLAADTKHDRQVALKVIRPELAGILGVDRFSREIRLAARLQHPHVCTVYDSGATESGQLWYTMPFVAGESLRDRIRRDGTLAISEAVRIVREAAQALEYAHQQGVIHRDIKPENILLTRDGNTLVADFGIARAIPTAASDVPASTALTETGFALGTPAYMSPEQRLAGPVDARSDVYSLAATLYELLTGEVAGSGGAGLRRFLQQMTDPAPRIRLKRPEVSEGLEAVVRQGLNPDPALRFNSMAAFSEALDAATGSRDRMSVSAGSSRRRWLPGALALLLVAAGAYAWRGIHRHTGRAPGGTRVAVLPFENRGDSADAYFADGVSDAIRGKLISLPSLTIIARGSSEQYRGSRKSMQEIGRELGVEYLLTGTVRWAKAKDGTNRVQVSPELVQVSTAADKWQQGFDAALVDVFQVQGEIAGKVASALDVALGVSQRTELTRAPTVNLAAYDAYLRGEAARQSVSISSLVGLEQAVRFFEQAVALDSSFAVAWAALSDARSWLDFLGSSSPERMRLAKVALDRAMALDSTRLEVQIARGDFYLESRRDPAQALEIFEVALRRFPASAELLGKAATAERTLGRLELSVEHLRQARRLDPRLASTPARLANTLNFLRRYPEALAATDTALALDPSNLLALLTRGMILAAGGDLARVRGVPRSAPAAIDPTALAVLFGSSWYCYWMLDDARQDILLHAPADQFGDPAEAAIVRAQVYAARGDTARARVYADTARPFLERQARHTSETADAHAVLGLANAYLGRKAEAARQAEEAVRLRPIGRDAYSGVYFEYLQARTYALIGERGRAMDHLEHLLKIPSFYSPGWFRIDPGFTSLHGDPRFERLASGQ